MATEHQPKFDPRAFLARIGEGRCVAEYAKGQVLFSQGEPAEAVFFIQQGEVKVSVVSEQGKEAVVAILGKDEFFGEGCLAGQTKRISTVYAMSDVVVTRIEKAAVIRLIHEDPAFSELFIAHLLSRAVRVEADLIDQLFNSSEKRLARTLLLLANFGQQGIPEPKIAKNQPRDARPDGGHDAGARELLHEQVPEVGFHLLQWRYRDPQFAAECRPARPAAYRVGQRVTAHPRHQAQA